MTELYALPGHLIRRLNQISVSVFAARVAEEGFDLTPVQFAALMILSENPGIDQATLAGLIAHDRVTIGGVVDRLEAKGLLNRTVRKQDRRARVLALKADGEALLRRIMPIVRKAQEEILAGLSESERLTFVELLRKATDAGNALSRAPLRHERAQD